MNGKLLFLGLVFLGLCLHGFAQTKITGVLIDSAYNRVLESATVSVYEQGKTAVDKVALTDRFGKFEILESAAGKPLILEFSILGYTKVQFEFQLALNEKKDFGKINMVQALNEIEAIEMVPPVRMNGDTIEFNANAFELDPNAVVEDLLNKLPGIVVWGDGAVTYNGRKVPTILVNGKPFFGTDMAIALQNIDKKAVDKLQVYDKRGQEEKEKEPDAKQLEMNLVLKKGKERMLFGNVGGGLGTDDRYQGSVNINRSKEKMQSTFAYSGSNVNKDLAHIDQLLRNTTFKGIGINADFSSDFLRQGILEQHVLGGRYQYDFKGTGETYNKQLVMGNITARWNKNRNRNESSTMLLNPESVDHNTRFFSSEDEQDWRVQNARFNYEDVNYKYEQGKRTKNYRANVWMENTKNDNQNSSVTTYDYLNNQSSNTIINSDVTLHKRLNFDGNFDLGSKPNFYTADGKNQLSFIDQLTATLQLDGNFNNERFESTKLGDYVNLTDKTLSKKSERKYDNDYAARYINTNLLLRYKSFGVRNRVSFNHSTTNNLVNDVAQNVASQNENLSHDSKFTETQYEPSVEFYKSLKRKYLDGRYHYGLNLNASLGARLFRNESVSTLDYRNLKQRFNSLLSFVELSYNFNRFGKAYFYNSLRYNYYEEYPNLNQLRPIYDDIFPGYRYYGAKNPIKETRVHQVNYRGNYNQQRQYALSLTYNVNYFLYKKGLTDSLVYAEGEQQAFTVQMPNDMHVLNFHVNVSKPFLVKKGHTLTFDVSANGSLGNKYQFVNSTKQEMINRRLGSCLSADEALDLEYQC